MLVRHRQLVVALPENPLSVFLTVQISWMDHHFSGIQTAALKPKAKESILVWLCMHAREVMTVYRQMTTLNMFHAWHTVAGIVAYYIT